MLPVEEGFLHGIKKEKRFTDYLPKNIQVKITTQLQINRH